MNQIFKIELEVITPIHISSGKEISVNNYIIKDGKFYKYNIHNIIKNLSIAEKDNFKTKITTNFTETRSNIYKYIVDNFNNINFEYTAEISKKIEDLYRKNLSNSEIKESNQFGIKEFIGTNNKKYVPGSSIKGAIRTAILSEEPESKWKEIESDQANNRFKFLMITDTLLFNNGIEISSIDRVSKNNFAEILTVGHKVNFKIKIKEEAFQIDNIVSSINNFYKKSINYNIDGLKKMNHRLSYKEHKKKEKNNLIIKNFENILLKMKEFQENEFIINLGYGGGKIFKTIETQKNRLFERRPNSKISIKSANVPLTYNLMNKQIMGWAKCKIIN